MNIRWFPPAWLQIKADGKVIYIDPAWIQNNFARHPKKVIYSHCPDQMDGLPEQNLPKADIVLITHHHQDHVKTVTLNRLMTKGTKIIAPARCSSLIKREFDVIKPGESRQFKNIQINAVFAYNTRFGASTRKVHHRGECVGYIITVNERSIYHAGDTDLIPEMSQLTDIDVAFLPIGGTFTMDIDEAVKAASLIKPKMVIPMHYLHNDPLGFKRQVEADAKSEIKILSIGGGLEI